MKNYISNKIIFCYRSKHDFAISSSFREYIKRAVNDFCHVLDFTKQHLDI